MRLSEVDQAHRLPGRCVFCGEGAPAQQQHDVNGFRIMRCECGLVYSDPRVAPQAQFARVYVEGYGRPSRPHPSQRPALSRLWRSIRGHYSADDAVRKRWRAIRRWLPRRGRLRFLDVGCNIGDLVELISAENPTWTVRGVEPSRHAAEVARRHGLNVDCGFLEEAGYEEDSFDVICAWDVIEHVPEPFGFLQTVRRVLAPGGRFITHCPNYESLRRRHEGPRWGVFLPEQHLYHYTPQTLRRLFTEADAEVLHLGAGPMSLASRILAVATWPD